MKSFIGAVIFICSSVKQQTHSFYGKYLVTDLAALHTLWGLTISLR